MCARACMRVRACTRVCTRVLRCSGRAGNPDALQGRQHDPHRLPHLALRRDRAGRNPLLPGDTCAPRGGQQGKNIIPGRKKFYIGTSTQQARNVLRKTTIISNARIENRSVHREDSWLIHSRAALTGILSAKKNQQGKNITSDQYIERIAGSRAAP